MGGGDASSHRCGLLSAHGGRLRPDVRPRPPAPPPQGLQTILTRGRGANEATGHCDPGLQQRHFSATVRRSSARFAKWAGHGAAALPRPQDPFRPGTSLVHRTPVLGPREAERPTPGLRGERGRENFLYSSTLPATERVGPTPESPGSPGQGNRVLNYEASVAENTPSLWRGLPRRMNFKICQQGITKALGAKSYSC